MQLKTDLTLMDWLQNLNTLGLEHTWGVESNHSEQQMSYSIKECMQRHTEATLMDLLQDLLSLHSFVQESKSNFSLAPCLLRAIIESHTTIGM